MPATTKPENLAAAMAQLQTKLPKIGKGQTADAGTYSYKYADLASISEQIMPLLGNLGLSFITMPTYRGDRFVLAYSLLHESGDKVEGEYPLPSGNPQAIGSAISYGRRYVLCAVTGVAPEEGDDDGRAAVEHHKEQERQPTLDPDVQARMSVTKAWTDSGRGESASKEAAERIGADFASWSGGELITEATVPRLYEYAAWLEANKVAAEDEKPAEAEQQELPEGANDA